MPRAAATYSRLGLFRALLIFVIAIGCASAVALAGIRSVGFKEAVLTSNASSGGVSLTVVVSCTGAEHFSAQIGLASNLTDKTFFSKTVTGPVTNGKGEASAQYRGAVSSDGYILGGSNTFCWATDKSMGVGYRDIYFATCPPQGHCAVPPARLTK